MRTKRRNRRRGREKKNDTEEGSSGRMGRAFLMMSPGGLLGC